jgi:hypothetical protein
MTLASDVASRVIAGAWTEVESHPSGAAQIAASVRHIVEMIEAGSVHPIVLGWGRRAVQGCPPRNLRCEVGAVLRALRASVRYTGDPQRIDLVQAPEFTLATRGGDCASLSIVFAAVGRGIGWNVGLLLGSSNRAAVLPTHVLPVVAVDGEWVPVEVSSRELEPGQMSQGFRAMDLVEVP